MSDPDEAIRLISTHCFATLIQLMPLDGAHHANAIASKVSEANFYVKLKME